ncbi:MAG: iron chelate uptake ABC transporter family permease subunit [Candidatus Bathyarchaeia archaeon]|nr:metal ABC transporter permease [Candidatus Bathyarchaeota archaeon]
MPDPLTMIFTHPFLQRALIALALTSMISATSGTFTVLRGLSFMPSAVAHAALGGAALAIYLQYSGLVPFLNPTYGAILFSLIVAVVTGYAGERGVTSRMEVAVGVTFAMAMSIAVFFMYYIPAESTPQIWGYLIGDIYLLTVSDLILLSLASSTITILTIIFLKEFTYLSFDMEGLSAHGLDARLYHYLLVTVSSLAIAVATKAVGAILVYAIMVAPAAAAGEWGKTVTSVSLWAFTIALTTQFAGLVSSLLWNTSPSAVAGMLVSLIYIGTILKIRKV